MMESSVLVQIKTVTSKLVVGHPVNGVNEIPMIKIFKAILIRVMSIGTTIKVQSRRVFDSVLVASILSNDQHMWNDE